MRCQQHKRYKATLRPRIDCVDCWIIYLSQTATYNDICQEIDRRLPKDEPGVSHAIDFGPEPIMDLLIETKTQLEDNNMNKMQKARKIMKQELERDQELRYGYQSNIAMLLHDRYDITGYEERNEAANEILKIVFEIKGEPVYWNERLKMETQK